MDTTVGRKPWFITGIHRRNRPDTLKLMGKDIAERMREAKRKKMEEEREEREQDHATKEFLRACDMLKELGVEVVTALVSILHRAPKFSDRCTAGRILMEHIFGKPPQAVIPAKPKEGQLPWEQLVETFMRAAEGGEEDAEEESEEE